MADARGLLLILYAGFAGILLLLGFVYKEIREYKEKHKKPRQLEFGTKFEAETEHKTHPAMSR